VDVYVYRDGNISMWMWMYRETNKSVWMCMDRENATRLCGCGCVCIEKWRGLCGCVYLQIKRQVYVDVDV